jgi:hypothetical protein
MTTDPSTVPSATPSPTATVSFTVDDALNIAKMIGALTVAINPAEAGLVALVTGAASLLRNTVMPAIQHLQNQTMSIAEQATLAAESAAERVRVGAPPAPTI